LKGLRWRLAVGGCRGLLLTPEHRRCIVSSEVLRLPFPQVRYSLDSSFVWVCCNNGRPAGCFGPTGSVGRLSPLASCGRSGKGVGGRGNRHFETENLTRVKLQSVIPECVGELRATGVGGVAMQHASPWLRVSKHAESKSQVHNTFSQTHHSRPIHHVKLTV